MRYEILARGQDLNFSFKKLLFLSILHAKSTEAFEKCKLHNIALFLPNLGFKSKMHFGQHFQITGPKIYIIKQ